MSSSGMSFQFYVPLSVSASSADGGGHGSNPWGSNCSGPLRGWHQRAAEAGAVAVVEPRRRGSGEEKAVAKAVRRRRRWHRWRGEGVGSEEKMAETVMAVSKASTRW